MNVKVVGISLFFYTSLLLATAPFAAQPPDCLPGVSSGPVQAPAFVQNLSGQTSWFASPLVYDLDGDGANELIAAYYDVYVFSSSGALLDRAQVGSGRVYAPHVVADLEGDGITEVVVGRGHQVIALEWIGSSLVTKAGWPADTTTGGNSPEIRGMAAADLDGNGSIEVVVTTTQTVATELGGAQVFVFSPDGSTYQPAGGHNPAWPRYNALSGAGNDADRNGPGHNGFGCYGLNVGIGDIDDDPELEIIVTYDNHHIQAFDHDGVAINASSYYTNRNSNYAGNRLTWGQFIRWADPQVEHDHYNLHTGTWPHPNWAEWLQWTASPPGIADLDGDGKQEVVGIPNVEMHVPYETQAYAIMVLEGAHGDGSRSARRKAGWEQLPRGGAPIQVTGWYPPYGVPAPTLADISGDARPEILVSLNDGYVYAYDANAQRLWRTSYRHNKPIMFSSEVTVADLNQDGTPELLLATYGDPNDQTSGNLMILSNTGAVLHDIPLPEPGYNGNGNGAPAAPAVGDLDGDGQLEVFVQTFDHGMDVFTVPGSGQNCLLWPTSRGGPLRTGQQNGPWKTGAGTGLAVDFGLHGLWGRTDAGWSRISTWNAGNGRLSRWWGGLAVDFNADGVWNREASSWSWLTRWHAEALAGWSGGLAADFGGNGLWNYDGTGWRGITSWNAGDGGLGGWSGGLGVDFDGSGLWSYDGSGWSRLTTWDAEALAGWSGGLAVDFGGYALWNYDGSGWSQLASWDAGAAGLAGWCGELAVDFDADGVWSYDGSGWSQLTSWEAGDDLSGWACNLAVDFDTNGLWRHDGTSWSRLANWDAEAMSDADLN